MDLSVVVPVKNEAQNIARLVGEIRAALDGLCTYEIVYVDDGSTDMTAAEIRNLMVETPQLRLLRHAQSGGQSAAICSGVRAARGAWVATLDGDGQNDPADIPELWDLARAAPPDPPLLGCWSSPHSAGQLVQARGIADRQPDPPPASRRRYPGHRLRSETVFPRLFLDLPNFDHMHRFLPALVLRAGGRVCSVPVNHRPRQGGASKYGVFDRLGVGIVDLCGVMWLQRRATRPQLLVESRGGQEGRQRPRR